MIAPRHALVLALVLTACGSDPPATGTDAGTTAAARFCSAYRAMSCPVAANCEAEFASLRNAVPAQCATLADVYFACGADHAAGTSCTNLAQGHFNDCATQEAAVMACANGGSDAGTTPACPSVGGTYAGTAPETNCEPATFTIMQPTPEGPCTVHINAVIPSDNSTYTGTNDPTIDASGAGMGGATHANADQSTVASGSMTFELSATGGRVSYNPGQAGACTYTLTR